MMSIISNMQNNTSLYILKSCIYSDVDGNKIVSRYSMAVDQRHGNLDFVAIDMKDNKLFFKERKDAIAKYPIIPAHKLDWCVIHEKPIRRFKVDTGRFITVMGTEFSIIDEKLVISQMEETVAVFKPNCWFSIIEQDAIA